jgi:hypothetical protein
MYARLTTHLTRLLPRREFMVASTAALLMAGCATTSTSVSHGTTLQSQEGVVVLRMVSLDDTPLTLMNVMSEEKEPRQFQLTPISFGQTQSVTFVGRMPAGRYQPHELVGAKNAMVLTVPIAKATGKFEVESGRTTDLGTMVFVPIRRSAAGAAPASANPGEVSGTIAGNGWDIRFALPLDPTSVPVDALLDMRFPQLAAATKGKSTLGWVQGTVPTQRPDLLDAARQQIAPIGSNPHRLSDDRIFAGGALGTVAEFKKGSSKALVRSTGAVQHIEATALLDDGRWLVGGEEGHVAVSEAGGLRWRRISGLRVDEVVIHLSQAPDRNLYMVTMDDGGSTVYRSLPDNIVWSAIKRIAAKRDVERQWMHTHVFRDSAVATRDRLAIYTRPKILTMLDFKSGAWETMATPNAFSHGLQATPDGLLVGTVASNLAYRSIDYGKNWTKMDLFWIHASLTHFVDRNRGYIVAGNMGNQNHKLKATVDGGKTWTEKGPASGNWLWGQPLLADASGSTFFTVRGGQLFESSDQGRTWK